MKVSEGFNNHWCSYYIIKRPPGKVRACAKAWFNLA